MASKYICTACRKASQLRSYKLLQLHTVPDRLVTSQAYRSFHTVHKHAASSAPEPAPYQSKSASKPGTNSTSGAPPPPPSEGRPRSPSTTQNIAMSLRENLPGMTETYVAYGVCERLIEECARQAEYQMPRSTEKGSEIRKTKDGVELGIGEGWWYETLNLPPTFETWTQITFLHMYLLTVRIRCFPPTQVKPWHQHLIDHFSHLAEDTMAVKHAIVARSERNKYLKDLFVQWRGLQAGYDEGLVRGDAVLATAVWRNVFKADVDVDWRGVGEVVAYMRHVLAVLGSMSDAEVAGGRLAFGGDPGSERDLVLIRARGMDSKGEAAAAVSPSAARRGGDAPAKGKMMPEGGK